MPISRRTALRAAGGGVAGLGAAAAAGAAAFAVVGQTHYAERFYPGVRIDGEDVGGLPRAAALARLRARWDPFARSPIVFRLDGRAWTPTGADVGVSVDYAAPLALAYAWGRRGGWGQRLREQRQTLDAPRNWDTQVTFDPHRFTDYLDRIAAEVAEAPVDARLSIRDQGGRRRADVHPASAGRELAPLDLLSVMSRRFDAPQRLAIELHTRQLPPRIPTAAVAPAAARLDELTTGHIEIRAPGHRWAIAREALAEDMRIEGPPDAPRVHAAASYRAFDRVAREIADTLHVAAVEPRIRVDDDGAIVPLEEGAPGRQLDTETLWARVQAAFASGAARVTAPLVVQTPVITRRSHDELQFHNLIAEGRSLFTGSAQNRIHNIDHGSKQLDGVVIPPGEVLSFNQTVGPITLANGFVEGLVIAPHRTEPGVGGGICQVSTTLFRAAFWAGLPIDERWQHVYRVGYYELGPNNPPGFDAAIWQPSQDLVFRNDTPNHILIRRRFDPGRASLGFQLMGPPLGRLVELDAWRGEEIEPPALSIEPTTELPPGQVERTDSAVPGVQTVIHRQVRLGNRVLFKDQFPSRFVPWPERWEVGQAEDGSFDPSLVPGYVPPEGDPPAEGDLPAEGDPPAQNTPPAEGDPPAQETPPAEGAPPAQQGAAPA